MSLRASLLAAALLFPGCRSPVPAVSEWNGEIRMAEGRSLPFRFSLDLRGPTPTGSLWNGSERTPIPEIRVTRDSITFLFSEYRAAMRGSWDGNEWRGLFARYRSDTTTNAFTARPGAPATVTREPLTTHALAGTFRAFRDTPSGIDSTMTATFWVRNDSVFGTLIAPDGDDGLLCGVQTGTNVVLHRYNGWQAFVLELEQSGSGWTADLFARFGTPEHYRLEPRPSAVMEAPELNDIRMADPHAPFAFTGITASGDTVRSTDSQFRGKVLLIDIMGTWCHNCMDAAPLLSELQATYGPKGLAVVGLAFEVSGDAALGRKNLRLYEQRYGITYPLLFCGSTKDAAAAIGSQANGFRSYPTTFFTDRHGVVRRVHVGFRGPGTGDLYERQVSGYDDIVRSILR